MPLDWLKFKRNKSRSAKSKLLSRKKSLARGASLRIASVPNLFNYVPPRQQHIDSAEKLFQALPKVQETSNRRASFYERLLPGAKEKVKENRRLSFYEGIYSEKSQFLTDIGTSIPRPLTPRRIHTEPTRFIHRNASRQNLRQPYKRSDYIPVRNAPRPPKSKRFYGDLGDVNQASGSRPISRNSSFKKEPAIEAPQPVHNTEIATEQLPVAQLATRDLANEVSEVESKARCVSSPVLETADYEQSKRYSMPVYPEGVKLNREKRLSYNPSPLRNSSSPLSISTSSQNSITGRRRPVKRRPVGGPRFIDLSANVSKDSLPTAEPSLEESKQQLSDEGEVDDASGCVQQEIPTSMIPAPVVKDTEDTTDLKSNPVLEQDIETDTTKALDEDDKEGIHAEVDSMSSVEGAESYHSAEPETIPEAINVAEPELPAETPAALEPQAVPEQVAAVEPELSLEAMEDPVEAIAAELELSPEVMKDSDEPDTPELELSEESLKDSVEATAAELKLSPEAMDDSVEALEVVAEEIKVPEVETSVSSKVFDVHEKPGVTEKVSIVELREEMNELSITEEPSYLNDTFSEYEPTNELIKSMTPWAPQHVDERFMDSEVDGGSEASSSLFSDQPYHRPESNLLHDSGFQEEYRSESTISYPHGHMAASSFTTAPSSPSMFADAHEEVPDTPFKLEPKRYSFVSMTSDASTALSEAQSPIRRGSSSPEYPREYHEGQLATNFSFPPKPSVGFKTRSIPLVPLENDNGHNETMLPAYPSLALKNGNGTNDLPFTHRSSDSYDSLVGYYM